MQDRNSVLLMRTAKTGYIVLSVLFCVLGVMLCFNPRFSALLFSRLLGIGMIVFGLIKLAGYFSRDLFRLAFQYDLASGILLIALGVIALTHADVTAGFLGVLLGVCVTADGLFKVQISLDAKRFGIRDWWLILILAIVTGAFGVLLLVNPGDSAELLGVFFGLSLLAEGTLNLCVALCTVKIVSYQKAERERAEAIEVDWAEKPEDLN